MNGAARILSHPEKGILVTILALCCFGLLMVYSSSAVLGIADSGSPAHYFDSQLGRMFAGLLLLVLFWRLDYRIFRRGALSWGALLCGLFLLVLLKMGILVARGPSADRWIHIFGVTIQPSEFARVGLVVFLAYYLSTKEGTLARRRLFLVPIAASLAMAGLIAAQPNLSMALIILVLSAGLLLIARLPIRWLLCSTVPPAVVALLMMQDYQRARILAFLGLGEQGMTYQVEQSLLAVGSGGLIGRGLGSGLQKYFFLPFPHTDFILGIVGEETGLLGISLLFAAFAFLIMLGIGAARRAPDRLGRYLAAGLTWNLAVNLLVHGAVNLGVGPVTGVPLPFFSCGGSSLIANLLAMGILLSVSRRAVPSATQTWTSVGGARS